MKLQGIYILTHRASGRQYVGQSQNLFKRVKQHLSGRDSVTLLDEAIKMYGADAFNVKIKPCPGITLTELDKKEQQYIKDPNTLHPNGFNVRFGKKRTEPKLTRCPKEIRQQWLQTKQLRAKQKEFARKLCDDGITYKDIQNRMIQYFGDCVSRRTISRWFKESQVLKRKKLRVEALQLYESGESKSAIARKLGKGRSTVSRWLKTSVRSNP